jgi:hypothetical protein
MKGTQGTTEEQEEFNTKWINIGVEEMRSNPQWHGFDELCNLQKENLVLHPAHRYPQALVHRNIDVEQRLGRRKDICESCGRTNYTFSLSDAGLA